MLTTEPETRHGLTGRRLRTLATIYAGRHKKQRTKLTRLDRGVVGVVRAHYIDECNIEFVLVRFDTPNGAYWAQLAMTLFEFV